MKSGCPYAHSHHEENYDYCELTKKKLQADDDKCDFCYDKCPKYRRAQSATKQNK